MELLLKSIVVLLILGVSYRAKADLGHFRCDYKYINEAKGWFKMHLENTTWNEASQICSVEGAQLASPLNKFMTEAMLSLMFMYDLNFNTFKVDANAPVLIHTGMQPTAVMQNSIELHGADALGLLYDGTIRAVNKYQTLPFICYKMAPKQVEIKECGTVDNEYVLDNRTKQCYKFHRERGTWDEASKICMIEEGHLAIINSYVEAEVIQDIFARNPADQISGDLWKDSAFLGYWFGEDRVWRTVEGESLTDMHYDVWSPGEPNNARGDEFCGSVGRNGMLFDDPCDRALPFICEKRTDTVCGKLEVDDRSQKYNDVPF